MASSRSGRSTACRRRKMPPAPLLAGAVVRTPGSAGPANGNVPAVPSPAPAMPVPAGRHRQAAMVIRIELRIGKTPLFCFRRLFSQINTIWAPGPFPYPVLLLSPIGAGRLYGQCPPVASACAAAGGRRRGLLRRPRQGRRESRMGAWDGRPPASWRPSAGLVCRLSGTAGQWWYNRSHRCLPVSIRERRKACPDIELASAHARLVDNGWSKAEERAAGQQLFARYPSRDLIEERAQRRPDQLGGCCSSGRLSATTSLPATPAMRSAPAVRTISRIDRAWLAARPTQLAHHSMPCSVPRSSGTSPATWPNSQGAGKREVNSTVELVKPRAAFEYVRAFGQAFQGEEQPVTFENIAGHRE